MKRRVTAFGLGVLALVMLVDRVEAQPSAGQHMASETYYTLNVAAGSLSARVDAEVQPAGDQLTEVLLWAMPGARDVIVTRDGQPLATKVTSAAADLPAIVVATLAQPLKGKLTAHLVMTYSVPPGKTLLTDLTPGAIETMLVSQGAGSFLLVDVPQGAENVLDPGCVRASKQPQDVRDAKSERWVCGEMIGAAFGGEDDSVRERCAALDDACRQRSLDAPFSAFVQSITDASLLSNLDANVTLAAGAIPLRLRYFRSDKAWADAQFSLAQRALPNLEALFGFPYPHDQILLRQSTYLLFGGALGIAFTSTGEMLLAVGGGASVDAHVTVHELAHQWAGLDLAEPWIWEGLAEYARRAVGSDLGLAPYSREWKSLGYTDPLSTMYNGSRVFNPDYWYGRSGDFWFAFEEAIGGRANMTAVLSRLGEPEGGQFDGRWFMDAGERVSGANLDQVFLTWVWQPDAARPTLAERRAAHDLVDALEVEAAALGLTGLPSDIQANLDEWAFAGVAGQVDRARAVLEKYRALLAATDEAGLVRTTSVAEVWGSTTTDAIASLVGKHQEIVSLLDRAGASVVGAVPAHPAQSQLTDARRAYDEGDLEAAAELASGVLATIYNVEAGRRMIAIARTEEADFHASFLERIGLLWSSPAEDLAAAEAAYSSGDYATALRLSQSAYETWNGAQARGLKRLAIMAAVMAALSLLTWWVLMRIDRGPGQTRGSSRYSGHRLDLEETPAATRPGWKDWENTP